MDYETAVVATNDRLITEAGGLPQHCLLLAKDSSEGYYYLLSVVSRVQPTRGMDLQILKEDLALTGRDSADHRTTEKLQQIFFECEILGTFHTRDGVVKYGADIDRVVGNSLYDVVKPVGESLSLIASFSNSDVSNSSKLPLGRVRYTETEDVSLPRSEVFVNIEDFIGKKTFLGGQTRSGKSNTIKLLAQKTFGYQDSAGSRVGQLIFDPQGEYANPNEQDRNSSGIPNALVNLGDETRVSVYKILRKDESPTEKISHLQLNFFNEKNASLVWALMLKDLAGSISANSNYTASLGNVSFFKPNPKASSKETLASYDLKMLGFWALFGFFLPTDVFAIDRPLDIYVGEYDDAISNEYEELEVKSPGYIEVHTTEAARDLLEFLTTNLKNLPQALKREIERGALTVFVEQVAQFKEGRNGVQGAFRRILPMHNSDAVGDVREKIWRDLNAGKLVIVDLSRGSDRTGTILSELVVNYLLARSSKLFTDGDPLVPYQIILEEAHNLFRRAGTDNEDSENPWVRLSKEASKYRIGLVYATQEVTSVDSRILSNTSNWLMAHLNSSIELKELGKYYSFSDWAVHMRNVETKGFIRMKTESSPFIVPVQVDRFEIISSSEETDGLETSRKAEKRGGVVDTSSGGGNLSKSELPSQAKSEVEVDEFDFDMDDVKFD